MNHSSKRVLSALALITCMAATACSSGGANNTAAKTTETNNASTAAPQPKKDDGKSYQLRLATVVSAPHPWIDMGDFFAKEVESKTGGKVKVSIHPSGQLGNDETVIDELRLGTIDFIIGGTQNAASFIPQYQIFGLSYLFKDVNHFEKAVSNDGPVFKYFKKQYEDKKQPLVLLSLSNGGARNVSNNKQPIRTPDDLKGMKMRLPGSPIESKIWSTVGALPTSLPFNEVYSAIQTGVVNAFESTLSGYTGSKLYEVAPYISKTEHLYTATHFTMSKATYDKLPDNYRKVIEDAAAEAGKLGSKKSKEYDDKIIAELGTKVKVNEVDKEAFIKKLAPLHDELAKDMKATEILEMIRGLQK